MKRWIIYITLIALTIVAPAKPVNIGNLLPVKAIGVYRDGSQYRIETDTGNYGVGETLNQALSNMKKNASGIIYLDKAEYLILTEKTVDEIETLQQVLKPNVGVSIAKQPIDLAKAAEYLDAHGNLPSLRACRKGERIPEISNIEKT